MKNKIFVQIASYRDPELVYTLRELFSKSRKPNNLTIGLAWQHDDDEILEEFTNHSQIKLLDIPYTESRGACWARNLIQYMYSGEEYTLQIDSHHRFIEGWDVELVHMLKSLQKKGYKKPLITSYLPSYDPVTGNKENTPWKLCFQRFLPEGPVFPVPEAIDNFTNLNEPIPSRLYSAHFAFTLGIFCKEVPHDPYLYFHGEEPSIAVRAFTHGYDLFHPHKVIGWHEYTRENKPRHWDDLPWADYNNSSYLRYRKLFGMDGESHLPEEFGRFGLGSKRSLQDYIKYSGIDITGRTVTQDVLDRKYPTVENINKDIEFLHYHKYVINMHKSYLTVEVSDYDFWALSIKDENKQDIVRVDLDRNEVNKLLKESEKNNGWVLIWQEWFDQRSPKYWAIWPHSESKGWLNLIEHQI
jgi:hypothetical protein